MGTSKKNILLFGANSFIAKAFIQAYSDKYIIYPVYRNDPDHSLNFDFNNLEIINDFVSKVDTKIDAVFFLQGINPSMSAQDITEEHFLKMLKVNLVAPVLLLAHLKEKLLPGSLVLFMSSVSKRKGSYDPSYAAAKSGLTGLMYSLLRAYPDFRFNIISLGLVKHSPVFNQMSDDFKAKHASRMHNGEFIKAENVISVMDMLISNYNINTTDIAIDGGYN